MTNNEALLNLTEILANDKGTFDYDTMVETLVRAGTALLMSGDALVDIYSKLVMDELRKDFDEVKKEAADGQCNEE